MIGPPNRWRSRAATFLGGPRFLALLAVGAGGLALLLRLEHRAANPLSFDETYQVESAKRPVLEFLGALPEIEFCSYISGDYLLTWPFVQLCGDNRWGLALPHLAATLAGFVLFFLLCRAYYQTNLGHAVALLLFLSHPTLIAHALEIRAYAVLPTLALGSFLGWRLVFRREDPGRGRLALLGAFFLLVCWFHVYGLAIVALPFFFFLLEDWRDPGRRRRLARAGLLLAAVFAAALPLWLYSVAGPHKAYDYSGPRPNFAFLANPLADPVAFARGVGGNLLGWRPLHFLGLGLLWPLLLRRGEAGGQYGFLLALVALPVVLLLTADALTGYWFVQRQFIWVMPYFVFLVGWTWDGLARRLAGPDGPGRPGKELPLCAGQSAPG